MPSASNCSFGRAEVEARYEGRVRDCEQRILVTDCLNRARKERRESLTPIDDRLATLDEADRARRAAERRARIDEKQARRAAAEQAEAAASEPLPPRLPKSKRSALLAKKPAAASAPAAAAKPSAAEVAKNEQAARERYERKQAEAAAHRAEVERRNAEGGKPAAAPLPPASRP